MANILINFHQNLATLERYAQSGVSEDERIRLHEDIAKQAKDEKNIRKSVEQIRELGQTAINTDDAFTRVGRAFETFVEDNGNEFAKTREFLVKWQGHHATWKKILTESRDFASATSGEYRRYDEVYLKFVQKMKDKEDMKEAIEALTRFSKNTNIEIPMEYAEKFKALGDEIKFFKDEFDLYLCEQGKALTDLVADLQAKLQVAEDTVKECNRIIEETAQWVEFIPIVGFFATEVTEFCMPGIVEERQKAQAEADKLKRDIEAANRAQIKLAKMQTQFTALNTEFQIICSALAIFANTWAYFHSEALKFANSMKNYDDVKDLPRILLSEVELSRAISRPLQEGLDAYAQVIVNP